MADKENNETPKIHIDDDWKAEARREKERLAENTAPTQPDKSTDDSTSESTETSQTKGSERTNQLPPADFNTLVTTMITQAAFSMGNT